MYKNPFTLGHILTTSNHVLENLTECCKNFQVVARAQKKPFMTWYGLHGPEGRGQTLKKV
jgi:hypothetical protein